MTTRTELEDLLLYQCRAIGLPEPEREVKLIDGHKWRVDFLLRSYRVCVEADGGNWLAKGGHNTGIGHQRDCAKDNALQLAGYQVYRFVSNQIISGEAVSVIEKALRIKGL